MDFQLVNVRSTTAFRVVTATFVDLYRDMPKDVTLLQPPQFVTLTKILLEFKIQQLKKLHNVQNALSQVNGNHCDMVHSRL